jgi:hypothetical protein
MNLTKNVRTGRANEVQMLYFLSNIGFASVREIGAWTYPNAKTLNSQVTKTQQVVKRLCDRGELKKRDNFTPLSRPPQNVCLQRSAVYVLTVNGAQRVRDTTNGTLAARDGYDLSIRDDLRHRTVVAYLTAQQTAGYSAVGRAGIRANYYGTDKYETLDGVVVDNINDTKTGVLFVWNTRQEIVEKIRRFCRWTSIKLLGNEHTVKEIERLVHAEDQQ